MDEYDYRIEDPSAQRIDEFASTKIFLAKTSMTDSSAQTIFNKEKIEAFKTLFKKPKDVEVQVKSVKKSYEPYLVISGQYEIRFLTERTYEIDLLDNAESVFILGEEIILTKKEPAETEVGIKSKKKSRLFEGFGKKEPKPEPEIKLKGIEHIHIKKDILEARNYKGMSIEPSSLPGAELSEVPEDFLKKDASMVSKNYINIDKFVQEIIDTYTKRPEIAQRVLYEKLMLTDKKIVLYPIYWAELVHKDGKAKSIRLDAVTAKAEVPKGTRFTPPPFGMTKEEVSSAVTSWQCPECHSPIEDDDTFCENCGVKLKK